jgi:hypothetical protein
MCILVAKNGSIIVVDRWRGGERTFAGSAPAGVLGTRYAFHVLLRIRHVEWNSGDLPPTSSRGWQTKMNIQHWECGCSSKKILQSTCVRDNTKFGRWSFGSLFFFHLFIAAP